MPHDNPFAPPSSNVALSEISPPRPQGPQGLGGWLILLGLGVALSPIRMGVEVFTTYANLVSSGAWAALGSAESDHYIPFWQPLLVVEMFINAALIVAWIYMASQFFMKKAKFPRLYTAVILFTIAFLLLDAWAFSFLMPGGEIFDPDTTKTIIRTVISALIWIPYLRVSKRVKATFIR